jgi:methylglutaconyl-CoA hydratase
MSLPLVTLSLEAGVAELKLNRPDKRNALTRALLQQAGQAVAKVASEAQARLLVLSAEGPAFSAGMDLTEMQQRAAQPDAKKEWAEDARIYRDLLVAIFQLPIPTLCVVQGPALAGGVGLVAACDLVLASEKASFALPEPKRGITAAVVAPLVIYRIGPGAATAMLLSGRTVSAHEALQVGFCHFLTTAAELDAKRRELCESILTGSPAALATTKKHLHACSVQTLLAQLDAGMKLSAEARETADAREGLAAFLEKRDPAWVRRFSG